MGASAEEATSAVIISCDGSKHPERARLHRLSLSDHLPLRSLETPPQATASQSLPTAVPITRLCTLRLRSISAPPNSLQAVFPHDVWTPSTLLQPPTVRPFTTPSPRSMPSIIVASLRRLAHRTPPSARESHAASPLVCTLACHTLSPPSVLCALIYRIT